MSGPIEIQNFIGGEFKRSAEFIDSCDPSTGKVFAKVPDSGAEVVQEAVDAAKAAFKSWSKTSVAERSKILLKIADVLESRFEEFAEAESRDQGKPIWLSKTAEIPRALLNFRHFATTAQCDTDRVVHQPDQGILNYTVHTPAGVAAIIVPWNLPLCLLTFKLAPALIYGNTVVVKPSEFTSVTAWMLCSVIKQAGVPPGVVNMVFGYGPKVGEALINHPDISLISFTGSSKTGAHIAGTAGKMVKKISLEMGGKNAAIVFDDADLEKCVPGLIRGSFLNSGQVCLSTSRIFVQKKLFPEFTEKFLEKTKQLCVGGPFSKGTFIGPLCSAEHLEKVRGYLKIAKDEGATFLTGKENTLQLPEENQKGYFVQPTILTNLSDDSRCMQEEIFGPITCLTPFETEEEVIERANKVDYGLCASLWSENVGRIHNLAPKLEVGTVWCNSWMVRNLHMPFGGTKVSGIGREGTEDSKEFYTTKKTICIQT